MNEQMNGHMNEYAYGQTQRGRNLFVTLLDNRDEAAERKQADDKRSVVRTFRIPKRFTERF